MRHLPMLAFDLLLLIFCLNNFCVRKNIYICSYFIISLISLLYTFCWFVCC